ncbi:hypothetical protein [Pseudomonas bohemica]|uniref:hypothetical protein n=1 Tax=Pseudomonas bohemica TaxID=2044872 RepID=UPI000DA61B38|nr:hypothetical protein [Pseudomonas bohemica]
MKNEIKPSYSYLPGIIISLLLAGWLAFLGLIAVASDDLGWGAMGLGIGAIGIGGPLALLLLIFWIVYMVRSRGQLPGRIHALLILPTLCAALVIPMGESVKEQSRTRFTDVHPPITEIHVNLSGHNLGLDDGPSAASSGTGPLLSADRPDKFVKLTRYPSPEAIQTQSFPYDGTHLKADVDMYRYMKIPYYDAPPAHPPLPMHRLPYPDLKSLSHITGEREGTLLVHIYFHYADHVDAAPAMASFVGTRDIPTSDEASQKPVIFDVYNYLPSPIVRVEVNGQTIDLGDYAVRSTPALPSPCRNFPTPSGGAFVDPGQPLTLRWQTLDEPKRWSMATVDVPRFSSPLPENEKKEPVRVLLYFLPDGAVAAERYLEIGGRDGKLAIRATGLPPPAVRYASCGNIFSRYDPDTVKLLVN